MGCQAGRNEHEDRRQERRSGEAVAKAGVEVAEGADRERADGVGDLGVGGDFRGDEVVDNVASEGDEEHGGHLLEFPVVDDDEAEGEGWDEDEGIPGGVLGSASYIGVGFLVERAVQGGPDCDAEAEEEGVDDGIDHADRAGDDVFGLKLEGAADYDRRC